MNPDPTTAPLVCCGSAMTCRDSRPYEKDAGNVTVRKVIVFLRRRRYRCAVCRTCRTTLELDYAQAKKMLANERLLRVMLGALREAEGQMGD